MSLIGTLNAECRALSISRLVLDQNIPDTLPPSSCATRVKHSPASKTAAFSLDNGSASRKSHNVAFGVIANDPPSPDRPAHQSVKRLRPFPSAAPIQSHHRWDPTVRAIAYLGRGLGAPQELGLPELAELAGRSTAAVGLLFFSHPA